MYTHIQSKPKLTRKSVSNIRNSVRLPLRYTGKVPTERILATLVTYSN
jgi:hypothetical protein